ncbi:hypothetical protein TIFTF001_046877 [Ficus carica]|uniref:Uncharacterized protein n=1 Tax=Ficus carica TaxID=3494 RepID=A0AA87YNW2_FICCA|nr:hypothetical protein TIFTF001_046877 [Ficus carica]
MFLQDSRLLNALKV